MNEMTYEEVGLELHRLIASMEPARWRVEASDELHREFERIRDRIQDAMRTASGKPAMERVLAELTATHEALAQIPSRTDVRAVWMDFGADIHHRYDALAEALKSCHVELPNHRPNNYARSITHVFFGVVALLFIAFSPWWLIASAVYGTTVFAWTLEVSRRYSEKVNDLCMIVFGPIAHPHERHRVNSSTWYASALSILALSGSNLVCVCGVTALAFGDPAAALIGRKFGSIKLVNNRSLQGTLAFAMITMVSMYVVLDLLFAQFTLSERLILSGCVAISGALAELLSRRVDDNFSIPLVSGLVAWVCLAMF